MLNLYQNLESRYRIPTPSASEQNYTNLNLFNIGVNKLDLKTFLFLLRVQTILYGSHSAQALWV